MSTRSRRPDRITRGDDRGGREKKSRIARLVLIWKKKKGAEEGRQVTVKLFEGGVEAFRNERKERPRHLVAQKKGRGVNSHGGWLLYFIETAREKKRRANDSFLGGGGSRAAMKGEGKKEDTSRDFLFRTAEEEGGSDAVLRYQTKEAFGCGVTGDLGGKKGGKALSIHTRIWKRGGEYRIPIGGGALFHLFIAREKGEERKKSSGAGLSRGKERKRKVARRVQPN